MVDGRQAIALIIQQSECHALPWLRFLLGEHVGDIVDDPGPEDWESMVVLPSSLLVCDRPDRLRPQILERARRAGTVGLVHLGDARYDTRLHAYGSFALVWRTYYHSALAGLGVRQLPLGPVELAEVTEDPRPEVRKPPSKRAYIWSIPGPFESGRRAAAEAFRSIDGGADGRDADTSVVGILAESAFAPCPTDGVHLESHRVYDALEMGAIPIVERRRHFDYFTMLLGDHPLPTVRSWDEARQLVGLLLDDRSAVADLQDRVVEWWTATKRRLAREVRRDVRTRLLDGGQSGSGPLDAMPPRWRGRVEAWRHRGLRVARS